ncbi:hypothetical protein L6R53_32350 [Myxococcota bacterium]|nr:hypothetical protein [Myxococcota bacterium]
MVQALRALGHPVFFDLDSLGPDEPLDRALERAATTCTAGVILARTGWGRSGWAVGEYDLLLRRWMEQGLPLVLVFPPGARPELPQPCPPTVTLHTPTQAVAALLPLLVHAPAPSAPPVDPQDLDALLVAGREAEAAALARRLLDDPPAADPHARLALLRRLVAPLLRVSDDRACARALDEAWARAEALDQRRADLAHDLALLMGRRGDSAAEAAWLAQARARAEAERDEELAARVQVQRALVAMRAGDAAGALALLTPHLPRWTQGDAPSEAMAALLLHASALRLLGQEASARARLEELRFRARSRGDAITEGAAAFELGTLVDEAEPDRALAWYQESLALARGAGDRVGEVRALAQAAVRLARSGRGEEARARVAEAVEVEPDSALVAWARGWVDPPG